MNYIKLYENFMIYCKNTLPIERLIKRNPFDLRLVYGDNLYVEKHHIIPKSIGGTNENDNIVVLLPEEHLFAHKMRYKAYNDRNDFISVRFIINGFNNKQKTKGVKLCITKNIKNSYIWMKQNSSYFRKVHGWQTQEGRERISSSRKGKFPVKDVITGNIIGSVEKDHPKVVSGEWVHHSKGRHKFYNKFTGEGIYCNRSELKNAEDWVSATNDNSGKNNSKFSGISDEEIYNFYIKVSSIIQEKYNFGELPGLGLIKFLWDNKYKDRTFPNLKGGEKSGFRFNGDVNSNLILSISKELNLKYNPYNKLKNKINVKEVLDDIN